MECKKRTTKCFIYDKHGNIIAVGQNQCFPPRGICQRQDIKQSKENYTGGECNSIHTEIAAISNLQPDSKPHKAILQGHDFYCDDCENALKSVGVKILEVE